MLQYFRNKNVTNLFVMKYYENWVENHEEENKVKNKKF